MYLRRLVDSTVGTGKSVDIEFNDSLVGLMDSRVRSGEFRDRSELVRAAVREMLRTRSAEATGPSESRARQDELAREMVSRKYRIPA